VCAARVLIRGRDLQFTPHTHFRVFIQRNVKGILIDSADTARLILCGNTQTPAAAAIFCAQINCAKEAAPNSQSIHQLLALNTTFQFAHTCVAFAREIPFFISLGFYPYLLYGATHSWLHL